MVVEQCYCVACLKLIIGPLYQCVEKHSICGNCKKKKSACLVCRKDVTSNRNYALEKIAASLTFKCQNSEEGCQVRVYAEKLRDHHKICPYRALKCELHFGVCRWTGSKAKLLPHLESDHEQSRLQKGHVISLERNQQENWSEYVLYSDEIFYINQRVEEDAVHWTVRHVDTFNEMERYSYRVKIEPYAKTNLIITEKCCNSSRSIREVIKNKLCASLPLAHLARYVNKSNDVYVEIEIYEEE